jgi:hypothetical protein
MRAVLLHLDRWVREEILPPDTRLMPLEARGDDPFILGPPPLAPDAVIQVPKVDQDGNDVGGVRLPDLQVPLGTHGGQNTPLTDVYCILSGSFVPFAKTIAEREATDDLRLSIQERYKDQSRYVDAISEAAWSLVEEGFILEEDALIVIQKAEQMEDFPHP